MYSLTHQSLFVLIGKCLSLFFQLLTPIILVRIFNQNDYGIYRQLIMFALLLIPISRFSMDKSLYYFLKVDNKNKDQYISQAYFIPLIISIFFGILIYLFSWELLSFPYIANYYNLSFSFILLLFFMINSKLLDHIFIIEGKARHSLYYFSFDNAIRLFVMLIFVFTFKTINFIIIGLAFFYFSKSIFLTCYLFKNYKLSLFSFNSNILYSQFQYIAPLYLSVIVGKFGAYLDKILLVVLLASSDFAIYSIGNFNLVFITIIYTSIGDVILPRLSQFSKNNNLLKAHRLWVKMIKANAMITIPTVLFLIYTAPEFISLLFTSEYRDSALVFQISILTLFLQMLGYGYLLRAFARTKSVLKANLIRTIIAVPVGYFLIKQFGVYGASMLFLFSFSLNTIIQLYETKKLLKINFKAFIPWNYFLKLFLISSFCLCLLFIIDINKVNLFNYMLTSSIIYFPILFIILVKYKFLKIEDIKETVYKVFKK
tara:strand:+ start:8989 stop:10443 length:1455 start_codon:yes stop_codon:yes gene_type:complete